MPEHVPEHTGKDGKQPAVGKVQGRWMNPPSRSAEPGKPILLSMYDDEDFTAVHRKPSCVVVCPCDGCGSRLTAYTNGHGTRWLAARPGSFSCDHNNVPLIRPTGGGGPETDEHLWMKARIARVCRILGYEAVIEHQPTRADVFLPDSKIAIEYQRWDTKFDKRNLDRSHAGADTTLWFFPEPPQRSSNDTDTALAKLFRTRIYQHGGIYLTAAHKNRRLANQRLSVQKPWERPGDFELKRTTRLFVSGSIVSYDSKNNGLKYTGSYGLHLFLAEVVRGERTLQDAEVHRRTGGVVTRPVWVLASDRHKIATVMTEAAEDRARRARAAREAPDQIAKVQAELPAEEQPAPALSELNGSPEDRSTPSPALPETPPPEETEAACLTPEPRRASLWERVRKAIRGRQ